MKSGRNRFSRPACPIAAIDLTARFSYDPMSGAITYKRRAVHQFSTGGAVPAQTLCNQWNARFADQRAFTFRAPDGYLWGKVGGRRVSAHRVAWALYHGNWPAEDVDHVNGIRDDNRLANLREVDSHTNCLNQRLRSDNKSGHHGVRKNRSGRWEATITCRGASKHLGTFGSVEEAAAARREAEKSLGFHENHGRKFVPIEATLSRTVVIDTFSEPGSYAAHLEATAFMRGPLGVRVPVHIHSDTDTGAQHHVC